MKHRKTIICLAQSNYWNDVPYPIHHMMRSASRHYRVLWINPTSVAFPSVKKKTFFLRALRRLRSHLRFFVKDSQNLYIFSPVVIPVFTRKTSYLINDGLLYLQLKVLLLLMGIRRAHIFASLPTFANVALALPADKIVYYVSDKYSGYEHVTNEKNKKILEHLSQKLILRSNYVLLTARNLFDEMSEAVKPKCFLMPHGVDLEFMQKANGNGCYLPADLSEIKKPIIGYFGSLFRERCDMENVRWCAEKRPDWSFVFIGRKWDSFPEIERLKNVHFLGPKHHNEIPAYGRHFDVCIISRHLNEAVKFSNPTKVNEFLALGKPVVSVPIDHLQREYEGLVSVAGSGQEFQERIQFEIENDSTEKIAKRLAKVKEYSWERMVQFLAMLFEGDDVRARCFFD